MQFDFDLKQRKRILETVFEKIENYYSSTKDFKTNPDLNIKEIRESILTKELAIGINPVKAIQHVIKGLENFSVHTPHPKYFGLFNPRSNYAGIIADLITATYNPQLAAWSHAPFAVEVEELLIKEFANKFGYNRNADGVFTTGGAEANLTAILCALNHKYSKFARDGAFGLDKKPVIFCSAEAHHSIQKAAKVVGLGYNLVKSIPTTNDLKLDTEVLLQEIKNLDTSVYSPLMIIGTAGTTGTGTIDQLNQLNYICKKYNIWFHVDAAYGGGAILSQDLKHNLSGIEKSDSITFDAHKWMSVPMGTSIFLTSKDDILGKTFRITTEYMPKEADKLTVTEPFTHSIQWSRRFIGLKVYLSLLFYGWQGYEQTINHQAKIGRYLKSQLLKNGWVIKNNTNLPVVCFTKNEFETDSNFTKKILNNILANGKSWLSIYPIKGISTFRACITNYNTTEKEIDELIDELNKEATLYAKQ
ncbi:pyridoxal phosphate-dependent decarboxylase family protein [Aureibacter tunicatorum]|uniref:Glutamate/tyrosine decarboxylase-like PLP-dependent enzyme n=1 Tax=Aureibacter tunicatorum TaxID=866807 RepID=A0AAE3XIW4_9BACT|nr:aminotransferase class V-fold PLP-dependent enzyme [Aureibacter tunicatorum]MDR6238566.1 glutamate/tyrosine decarboxylase-like PLP-dependent enzyme [Aureibacter tunicatorum]BDD05503.1 pyridoxal-dependent decarboxylase [Aureibacter tunicatorum]